jgi:hypothetical protein
MVIRYLKDDLIIKAKEETLKIYIEKIDTVPYPFTLFKNSLNDDFMICNSSSCFGHEKEFSRIISRMQSRTEN